MLSKSLGNHAVSLEKEKERLQWEGFAEEEGFLNIFLGVFTYKMTINYACLKMKQEQLYDIQIE